jgi:D-lyxose ketol-isomerase
MKRSEMNAAIADAMALFYDFKLRLPPWAYWTPDQWRNVGSEADEIRNHGMGWIVTDFGSGDFNSCGLTVFVVRNGRLVDGKPATSKTYAQKFFLIRPGQKTPYHFHWMKTEDLLNHGGGRLNVQLAWPNPDERSLSTREVRVQIDGIKHRLPAEGLITLEPGQSVEFPPMLSHQFWGHPGDGKVFAGEVSSLNDDSKDNCFLGLDVDRTPIVEDELVQYLLLNEYPSAVAV